MPLPRPTLLVCLGLCAGMVLATAGFEFSRSRFEAPPAAPAASGRVRLAFVGDCKLGGRTAQQIATNGPGYPFGLVADPLRAADIAFANYESAITDLTTQSPGKPASLVAAGHAFVFKSDPATTGDILTAAGIDIVQLANNHAMDYCAEGLLDTLAALDDAAIAHVGAGADWAGAISPVVITANGVRVGYLAYSQVVPPYSAAKTASPGIAFLGSNYKPQLEHDIVRLRESCDLVVVGYHWGIEGKTMPNKAQRTVAHATIDAGADLVIGSHPHSFQGVELYGNGVIAYSLGNFVFTGSSRRLAGGILAVDIEPPGRAVSLLPCWINDGRPTPSTDRELRRQLTETMRATGSSLQDGEAGWLRLSAL